VRIVIAGAGATGGYIGARLWQRGADVVLVARGGHLDAMRTRGLRVISPDGDVHATPVLARDLDEAGPADVVLRTVKTPALTELAPRLAGWLGPDTVVVSAQNGLPWWYFQHGDGPLHGVSFERVDPGGRMAAAVNPSRVVGSLIYFSAEIVEPGVIRHREGRRISFGEPDGTRSARTRLIAEALIAAGFRCPITTRLRHEIWVKLLGNVAFNPLSMITGLTLESLARHPEASRLVRTVMAETEAVAARLGIDLPISIDQRLAGAARAGAHRTSMLQDYEAGRPVELEAVVGAVLEVADRLGVPMPATHALYACAALLDETRWTRGAAAREPAAP
jgi:2-dehydropantoate 2-reductase